MVAQVTAESIRESKSFAITMKDAAAMLGVDRRTVSQAVADGTLPAIRLGRRVVIPRERFLAMFDVPASQRSS